MSTVPVMFGRHLVLLQAPSLSEKVPAGLCGIPFYATTEAEDRTRLPPARDSQCSPQDTRAVVLNGQHDLGRTNFPSGGCRRQFS
jgi:hypothetical protein